MALPDPASFKLLDALHVGQGTDLVGKIAQWNLRHSSRLGRRDDRGRPLRPLRGPGDPPHGYLVMITLRRRLTSSRRHSDLRSTACRSGSP